MKFRWILTATTLSLLLSACGQKGDLYLPQPKNPAVSAEHSSQSSSSVSSAASETAKP